MHPSPVHLVWFRNDLRVTDNKALFNACQDKHAQVHALFTITPEQWRAHHMALSCQAFIHDALLNLSISLAQLNIPLILVISDTYSNAANEVARYCQQHQVTALFFNHQYALNEQCRDKKVTELLENKTTVYAYHDNVFIPPGNVVTQQGEMYKVFTPFRNAFLRLFFSQDNASLPIPEIRTHQKAVSPLKAPLFSIENTSSPSFIATEEEALKRLKQFCYESVPHYAKWRDIPAVDGTSRLSPYLTHGLLSVRQCFNRLYQTEPDFLENSASGAFVWFNELIWREFYQHLMVANPHLCKHIAFQLWTEKINWRNDKEEFNAWAQGLTGFPIIDAAMRQLNHTGWMHNRLRMLTASFLVKDLLIDWRWGERYFMSQLIDGDFASNNGGWQWAASTGTDAVPYFRIFNPTTQGRKFDPDGEFIRHWLPELAHVPSRYIHTPHEWAAKTNNPLDYPLPIVDHAKARISAIESYEEAKKG
ncbi:deoxyribodipyrimidine photo-lyase [Proteus vulgaris]|uniref:Deoxyribodipyrimidine photo-lyase n=1 Tax=Proteus vulgaris TaxID=585 RepID=A0A6G6SD28_PROVU|nr:deoxyribodipyrimidine photo-lyase [Proteus vulgaris]QIF92462.1 deoxyribodipyrimidine photo-lyase [Proteus vulgaris]